MFRGRRQAWRYLVLVGRLQRADVRDAVVRVLAPGVVLWSLIIAVGFTLRSLTGLTRAEDAVNISLAAHRSPGMNTVTLLWSHIGNTGIVTATVLVLVGLVWWRTRDWRLSVFPAIAVFLQLTIFLAAANLVDRHRPPVPELDPAPPTSSYPSGHVGASTALYVSIALLAARLQRAWVRRSAVACSLAVPFLVAFGRLYRGMHHVSDVAMALVNGLLCSLLAFGWYRRRTREQTSGGA
jgi:membrane-associated phospholipid phosphatase